MYNINPIEVKVGIIESTQAVGVDFFSSYVPFSTSMPYSYTLYDSNGKVVYNGQSSLDEVVLAGWGDSDVYIIEAMSLNLGLTLLP